MNATKWMGRREILGGAFRKAVQSIEFREVFLMRTETNFSLIYYTSKS
jgi:hypothetical protein